MARRIVPWLPWLLAGSVLAYLQWRLWAGGFLFFIGWTLVLLLYRAAAVLLPGRAARLALDLAFAGLCGLAVFEGGWYLLPAVLAFAACDAAGLSIELPSLPPGRDGHALAAALAALVLGWLGLAIGVSGPLYASASSVVTAGGTVVTSGPALGLLQTGMSSQLAALLVALALGFALVPIAVALNIRRPGRTWLAVAVIAAGLTLLAALAVGAVGLATVPGVALAWSTCWIARPERSAVGPS